MADKNLLLMLRAVEKNCSIIGFIVGNGMLRSASGKPAFARKSGAAPRSAAQRVAHRDHLHWGASQVAR